MVQRTNKLDEQGKRVRVSDAIFDHEKRKVTWTERDPNQNQPPCIISMDFSRNHPGHSSMIYLCAHPEARVGKSFEISGHRFGAKCIRMTVAVVERKQIKCVLGRVNAIRMTPAMFGEGRMLRGEGQNLHLDYRGQPPASRLGPPQLEYRHRRHQTEASQYRTPPVTLDQPRPFLKSPAQRQRTIAHHRASRRFRRRS